MTSTVLAAVPHNPQTEAEVRTILTLGLTIAAVVVRGPNSQALVGQLMADLNDPLRWGLLLNVLLGPPPAPVPA